MFVAIEGTDGAGKTTIRRLLYGSLNVREAGVLAVQGQSYLAPEPAKIITDAKFRGATYPPNVITAATVADKEVLCERVIQPHRPWRTIIADRWTLSDVVYNQALFGVPMETTMRAFTASRVLPADVLVLVDTAPELAWQRIVSRRPAHPHRWDSPAMLRTLHELFRIACDWLPPEKIVRLPNDESPERTAERLLSVLHARGL